MPAFATMSATCTVPPAPYGTIMTPSLLIARKSMGLLEMNGRDFVGKVIFTKLA